ncbi:uncharacterized protein plekho2 [Brachyhypopomus gauderio]|uniref:uncharacterized protein plekho2 n=1 Tax=Brachyhypopomus gauderio TaxID=698409 RepID=UPI004043037A
MEDGVKEDPAKPKEMKLSGQAGWLKKASGKFLGGYKDRYIQLDKTQIVVYDNEDLKNCIERVDLDHFDKCHELRSPFNKKHRLIVTRAAKSGSKVCDVKLQAQNQQEKEAWIKALNDGIIRAKNKIFDEVKLEQPSLEHVTRSRPKGNRSRRPPTRIHMKEVANVSSDGILRLDLSATDSTPNGTHCLSADGNGQNGGPNAQEAPSKSLIPEEAAGEDSAPQKKVLKPPMPPSKVANLSESQESDTKPEDLAPQKKILVPPMPPSKELKPSEHQEEEKPSEEVQENKVVKPLMPPSKVVNPSESQESDNKPEDLAPQKKILMPPMPPSKEQKPSENQEEEKPGEEVKEKKVVKPPMPPSKENKPTICGSGEVNGEKASDSGVESGATDSPSKPSPDAEELDNSEASPAKTTHPPSTPSKDMKPKPAQIIKEAEVIPENHEDADDDNEDVKDNNAQCQEEAEEENTVKTEDIAFIPSKNVPKPQEVMWDSRNSEQEKDPVEHKAVESACPDNTESVAAPVTTEPAKPYGEIKLTPCSTPEPVKKSTAPPAPPKKKPLKPPVKKEDSGVYSGTVVSTSSSLPPLVSPSVEIVSENVPADDMKPATQEPKSDHKVVILSLNNTGVGEDSTGLCGVECEEKSVDSGQLSAEESENSDQVTSSLDKMEDSFQGLDAETSEDDLESLDTNVRSTEDVPSANGSAPPKGTVDTFVSSPLPATSSHAESSVSKSPSKMWASSMGNLIEIQVVPQESDIKDLQSKVSVELEETGKLLREIGNEEGGGGGPDPGILLSTAMEKLQKAEQFLKEAKSVKQHDNKSNRTSW